MFYEHLGRCSGHTSLQRCALQPTQVMLPSARWRAVGLLPLAQEAVCEGFTGPNPPVGTHFFSPIRLVASLLHSVCSRLRAKNVVIRSYEGRKPARSFASMNSSWYALLALGLVAWVLQPVFGLYTAAILPAAGVRQYHPRSLNVAAVYMNRWVEFMNMRVKFKNTGLEFMYMWVEFMNIRVEFMSTCVKFMNTRGKLMNSLVELMSIRVKLMNTCVEFMNRSVKFMSTRVACMNNRACAMRVAAPCPDGRTQRTWPMQARGPPHT